MNIWREKMRKLSDEEKRLNSNAIKKLEKEIESAEYVEEMEELKLKKGWKLINEANIQESKSKIDSAKSIINGNKLQIEVYKEQNEKGVNDKNIG